MGTSVAPEVAVMTIVNEVRSLFHELKVVVQEVHGGSALTGGLRGVLVDLLEDGDQTVPELARRRPVSRQHIQVLVNELLVQGMVVRKSNPAHKRSKLVSLTAMGRRTVSGMLGRERTLLRELKLQGDPQRLMEAAAVLQGVRTAFRDPEWRASINEG